MTKLVAEVLEKNNLPSAIFTSFCGGAEIGQAIAKDTRIPLVSFTGSSKVTFHILVYVFIAMNRYLENICFNLKFYCMN